MCSLYTSTVNTPTIHTTINTTNTTNTNNNNTTITNTNAGLRSLSPDFFSNNQLSETESLFMISMDIPVSPPLQVTHQHQQQQQHQHNQNIMQQQHHSPEDVKKKREFKSVLVYTVCIIEQFTQRNISYRKQLYLSYKYDCLPNSYLFG